MLSEFPRREKAFQAEASFLAAQPGPALCESLLLCYDAGKPHILNPLGVAVRARLGKGSNDQLLKQIAERKYGAIQTDTPATQKPSSRFPDDVLDAIDRYYVEALKGPSCYIYVPRVEPKGPSNPR
jgi:hypothetical protein